MRSVLPVDVFGQKSFADLQFRRKANIPNPIPLSRCIFELPCINTYRHTGLYTDELPKWRIWFKSWYRDLQGLRALVKFALRFRSKVDTDIKFESKGISPNFFFLDRCTFEISFSYLVDGFGSKGETSKINDVRSVHQIEKPHFKVSNLGVEKTGKRMAVDRWFLIGSVDLPWLTLVEWQNELL